ncbi:MAG: RIP metalloprotease [Candidatus Magasanikbacteria bacterium]|nr:RIP metalloprotease [Candidatus Magasanikbacteria bacterium]
MVTLLIFIAVLAVLVLSHEFGHFIMARFFGMKVDEFGFGFPPRLCGVRRLKSGKLQVVWGNKQVKALEASDSDVGGTIYSFNWLPLGGFVKIKGENGSEGDDTDSFASKKAWQRASVLVAGVVMNIFVAFSLITLGFIVGWPQSLDGMSDVSLVNDRHVEVMQVLPGKPAEAAGVQAGDQILAVGTLQNPRLDELRVYVNAHKNETIAVRIMRGEEKMIKQIHPTVYADTGQGGLGVAIAEIGTVRYPWYQAIGRGAVTTARYLKIIVVSFYFLLKDLFLGHGVGAAVSGPIGIAVMTGQVARMGWVYLIQFIAMLSLNLAVLNILPIPALDGGRLLFVVIGTIVRRSVTPRVEQTAHAIGFLLLMLLVVAVTVKDLSVFSGVFVNFWNNLF